MPRAVKLVILHIYPRIESLEHIVAGVAVNGDGGFEGALLGTIYVVLEVHAVIKHTVLIGFVVEIVNKAVEIVAVIEGRAVGSSDKAGLLALVAGGVQRSVGRAV